MTPSHTPQPGLRIGRLLMDNWGVLLLFCAWEFWVSVSSVGAAVLPHLWQPLLDIAQAPQLYLEATLKTMAVAAAGLAIGFAAGAIVAVLSWLSRAADAFFSAGTLVITSVPVIAFIPVLGRLMGYQSATIVAIVALVCFFVSLVLTLTGLRRAPPGAADLFAVLGASRWTYLRYVAVRAALPSWSPALRLAAPAAVLSTMTGEFLMGIGGLGSMMQKALEEFDTARAVGVGLMSALLAFAGSGLAPLVERLSKE